MQFVHIQHPGRQRRRLTQGIIGLATKASRANWTIGVRYVPGLGRHRALDYLNRTNPLDRGTSAWRATRAGAKAAVITMAYDSVRDCLRQFLGEGGTKLHRRNWGELVENIAAEGNNHWMAGNVLKYAGPLHWNDLPWTRTNCGSVRPRPF